MAKITIFEPWRKSVTDQNTRFLNNFGLFGTKTACIQFLTPMTHDGVYKKRSYYIIITCCTLVKFNIAILRVLFIWKYPENLQNLYRKSEYHYNKYLQSPGPWEVYYFKPIPAAGLGRRGVGPARRLEEQLDQPWWSLPSHS